MSAQSSTPSNAKEIQLAQSICPKDILVGDIIFTKVKSSVFKQVSTATNSWTNHVGIVVENNDGEVLVAESTFPVSRTSSFQSFIERSEEQRFAIARLHQPWSPDDIHRLRLACLRRMGIFYGTGFDLGKSFQFCSRFVFEVVEEAVGVRIGEVETFETLLNKNPDASLGFWRLWFFGRIPWDRKTVTPASVLESENLSVLFDSHPEQPTA